MGGLETIIGAAILEKWVCMRFAQSRDFEDLRQVKEGAAAFNPEFWFLAETSKYHLDGKPKK